MAAQELNVSFNPEPGVNLVASVAVIDPTTKQYLEGIRDEVEADRAEVQTNKGIAVTKAGEAASSADAAAASETAAQASATSASTSESNAASSASAASTSEFNAKASETAADTSEANALASEQASAASEANALASEQAAKLSETNAANSEDAALASENNASNSESAAAGSATAAFRSETNAALSASEAAASATSAGTSADAAMASETAAKASESNALQSKNLASQYANAASTSEVNAKASETASAGSASAAATSEANAATSATAASTDASAAQVARQSAESAKAATETLFDQFGDQYLGPKASDPTTDNDGNPLQDGAVYFNTTDGYLKFYSGTAWVAPEDVTSTAAANAQASESAAATSASEAAGSATSASNSASAAATSESNAASSETAAASSASSANTDAGIALTKASEASTSASNAATFASNAATSEANAAQSASTAETAASDAVATHESKTDPHPQYTTETEAAAAAPVQSVQGETGNVDLSKYFEPRRSANMVWNPVSDSYSRDQITTGVTPIHEKMRRCVLRDDGTVAYYLDPHDSTLKADGSPANLVGTDGQVMVEVPKCWVRFSKLFNGDVKREISEYQRSGFVLHPAFVKAGTGWQYDPEVKMWHCTNITEERDVTHVGAYQASVYDTSATQYIDGLNLNNNDSRVDYANDILASVSGRYPMVGVTRAQMRQLASNRGAGWHQWTFWQWNLIKLLFFVEYGGFDGQALLAAGNNNVSSGYPGSSSNQSDSPHSVAGKSNIIGNGSGGVDSTSRDTAWMSYRGIENFWGNAWQFVDGFNVNDWIWYISNDPSTFADDTTTGYNQLGEAAPSSNGYVRNVQHETLGDVPSDSGGNSSTAFADHYWQNSGWRMALVGGDAAYGANGGPSCVYVGGGSGRLDRAFAGRLAFSGKP